MMEQQIKKSGLLLFTLCVLSFTLATKGAWAAPMITAQTASGYTGNIVNLPITFDPTTSSVASLQFDLILPVGVTGVSFSTGNALVSAVKSVGNNMLGSRWRFVAYGLDAAGLVLNKNSILSGTLLTAQLQLAANASAGTFSVGLSSVAYSDPNANAVTAGTNTAGSLNIYSACDVNQNWSSPPDIFDVRAETNMALGTMSCTDDITHDPTPACNILDVRRVTNAALGGPCVVGP